MRLELDTTKALEYLLFREYMTECRKDESLYHHRGSLNFYEWLQQKGLITKEHMNRQLDNIVYPDFED